MAEKTICSVEAACELIGRAVTERLAEAPRLLVAMDGRCASGKTTLAAALRERYGWSVIHMDHFFLRPEQRTPERYATPGENVDHERFLAEVLEPWSRGELESYRPFDCHALDFGPAISVPPTPVTVVEGSYSCHPTLWDSYGLRVFLTVGPTEQLRRVEARSGKDRVADFRDKWIPLEEAYLKTARLEERCHMVLELDQ